MRIISFPLHGNAYTECLGAALCDLGVEVIEGQWSGRWLLATVKRGDVALFNWPSFHYFYPRSRRRTWYAFLKFCLFLVAMRLRGCAVVWTAHNLYPHDGGNRLRVHRLARRVMVACSRVVSRARIDSHGHPKA